MGLSFPSIKPPSPRDIINGAREKASGVKETVTDTRDKVRDHASDYTDRGREFVTDNVDRGREFVTDNVDRGREFVTDNVDRGREFVTDNVDRGREFVTDNVDRGRDIATTVGDKIEQGAATVAEKVTEVTDSVVDSSTINVEDVESLNPGDSVTLDAKIEGGGFIVAGAETEITVSRNDDGTYTVTQDAGAKVGVGFHDFAEAGGQVGGTREYTFDNPEDAARAAQIIQKQTLAASASQIPPTTPLGLAAQAAAAHYVYSGDAQADQDFLDEHTSLIEVSVDGYLKGGIPKVGVEAEGLHESIIDALPDQLDGQGNGVGGLGGAELEVSTGGNYAFEYDNGEKIATVESVEINVSGNLDAEPAGPGFLSDQLPEGIKELDGEITARIEKRTSIETGEVEYSLTITAEGDSQDNRAITYELSGSIQQEDIGPITQAIAWGNPGAIKDIVNLEDKIYSSDVDRNSVDIGIGVGEAGAGKEFQRVEESSVTQVISD